MNNRTAWGRGQVEKELLLDMVRQASKTACLGDKIVVVLETLLDTPVFEDCADERGGFILRCNHMMNVN